MATIDEQIAAAKAAGYSDADITKHLSSMQDFAPKIKAAEQAGYKPTDIVSFLSKPFEPPKSDSLADKAGTAIYNGLQAAEAVPYLGRVVHAARDIPRALTQVVAHGVNAVAPSLVSDADLKAYEQAGASLEQQYQQRRLKNAPPLTTSDLVTGKQKDAGIDWARMGTNALLTAPLAPATAAASLPAMIGKNALFGAALGMATPVDDGSTNFGTNKLLQTLGGGVIGGAAPLVINPLVKGGAAAINAGVNKVRSLVDNATGNLSTNATATINAALQNNGIDISKLPKAVQADLLQEVEASLKAGGKLDMDALRRKADFLTVGAKPVLGQITRDPVQFTREQTLKGVQGAGEKLANTMNENNRALIGNLNTKGAAGAQGSMKTGDVLVDSLGKVLESGKARVTGLYDKAKALNGGDIALDHVAFTQGAGEALNREMKTKFLPTWLKSDLNDIAQGNIPLNVSVAEQLKTNIATAIRSSTDGNEKVALGLVRDALDNAPAAGKLGEQAVAAFGEARAAHAALRNSVKASPALKAIEDGVAPDKFFDKHIIGANLRDVKSLVDTLKADPATITQVRAQVADFLKQKALNGASDEVGTFSQSAYNKALRQLGDDKLALFFKPAEVNQLKAVGRVASYMQTQPAGSAVNNSNTASQGFNLLMRAAEKVPGGKAFVVDPLNAAVNGSASRNSLSARIPVSSNPLIDAVMQQQVTGALAPFALTMGVPAVTR